MGEPNVEMVQAIAEAIWEKKGFDVAAYAVGEVLDYTDCMMVVSAGSDRQTLAIASSVEQVMRERYNEKPYGREGRSNARWVLLDFTDVVVHIFHRPVRDYYELDRLYGDVPRVELEEPAWVQGNGDPASDWATVGDFDEPKWDKEEAAADDDDAYAGEDDWDEVLDGADESATASPASADDAADEIDDQ